ncbi:MAG TPA: holo-[acyl-carrier-protein] synthase [Anaerolineaceae bacterium]|nr:holo-[acyl-carrier-protein] synthase [Anaerolineaceae bacterium]
MIIRTGVDIVEIERFDEQSPEIRNRFFRRVFTARELALIKTNASAAGRFAAKEAVAKALGCGIGTVGWQDIEILSSTAGEPTLILHGAAQAIATDQQLQSWSVSISHSKSHAIAFATALGTSGTE